MGIYLTRHGETDWNLQSRIQGKTDIALNENGRRQALLLAELVRERKIPFHAVYYSKLIRARETAEIVADQLGVLARELPGVEEINLGRWEGITWKQVREAYPEEYGRWHENRRYEIPPEGESYDQLLQRVVPALKQVREEGQNVLVVTHSAVIMSLFSWLHQKPFEDMAKNFKTGNTELLQLTEEMENRLNCLEK